MKQVKQILNTLHEGLSIIDREKLSESSLYYVDENSGDMSKVCEIFEGHSAEIVSRLKNAASKKVAYCTMYQDALVELAGKLTPSEIKILFYLLSKMNYGNVVYGITYRGVSEKVGVSVRTVTDAMNSLIAYDLVRKFGTTQKKMYVVNPAVAWKGNKLSARKKIAMFKNVNE